MVLNVDRFFSNAYSIILLFTGQKINVEKLNHNSYSVVNELLKYLCGYNKWFY